MKTKKYAIVCYILAFTMLFSLSSMAITPDKEQFKSPDYVEPYVDGADEGKSPLSISIDYEQSTKLNIIVTDSRTGKTWESNPVFNDESTLSRREDTAKTEKSQIVLRYSYDKNASADNLADIGYMSGVTSYLDYFSFDDCVKKDQVEIEEINDDEGTGYKITYTLGSVKAPLFPKALTEESMQRILSMIVDENGNPDTAKQESLAKKYQRIDIDEEKAKMEEDVAKYPADKQEAKRKEKQEEIDNLLTKYPYLATGETLYALYSDAYGTLQKQKQMVSFFESIGYTREDMEADYELAMYTDPAGGTGFTVPVKYLIQGNTFKVEVMFDEMVYPANVEVTRIDVLPNFASCLDKDVTDGYIFVPDGSGAIININKSDRRTTGLTMQLLEVTKDEALSRLKVTAIREIPYYEKAIMPVFGMKQDDNAVMCIIERGYELSYINAYLPDADGQSQYNQAYASIYPVAEDDIFYSSGSSSSIVVFPKVEVSAEKKKIDPKTLEEVIKMQTDNYCRLPATNYVIRYSFLSGDDANYSGMANYFRNYLIKTYNLDKIDAESNTPFYTDIYGAIDKKISIAGFPFNSKYALTTFDEAEIIANTLKDAGIPNISMRYLGIVNGGFVSTYPRKFNVVRSLGNDKGYVNFLADMKELGVDVIPDIDITHVYKDKLFDGFTPTKDAVETLGMQQSIIYDLNVATGIKDNYNDIEYYHPRWAISPTKYTELFEHMMTLLDKFDNKNISFGSVGAKMTADYDDDMIVDRTQTSRLLASELSKYKENGYKVTVERGNFYTLPYVSTVLNIPLTSSFFRIEDYEVPFVQMVLHGLVYYTGEPLNVTQDARYTILKCLEYGSNVYARFMYEEDSVLKNTYFVNLYSLHYSNWIEESSEIYETVDSIMADIQDQYIVNHERLAENVYMSTYEDGTKIVVNYGNESYSENGISVAGRDYLVIKGGK